MRYLEAFEFIDTAIRAQGMMDTSNKMKETFLEKNIALIWRRSIREVRSISLTGTDATSYMINERLFDGKILKVESTSTTGTKLVPFISEGASVTEGGTTDTDRVVNAGYWIRHMTDDEDAGVWQISAISSSTSDPTFTFGGTINAPVGTRFWARRINTSNGPAEDWNDKMFITTTTGSSSIATTSNGTLTNINSTYTANTGFAQVDSWKLFLSKGLNGATIKVYYFRRPLKMAEARSLNANAAEPLEADIDMPEDLATAAIHYTIADLHALTGNAEQSEFHLSAGDTIEGMYNDSMNFDQPMQDILPPPLPDFT